jgi:hypothetical protein
MAVVSRRAEAIDQAIALQPDGIVLGTIDADEQAAVIGPLPRKASSWWTGLLVSSDIELDGGRKGSG